MAVKSRIRRSRREEALEDYDLVVTAYLQIVLVLLLVLENTPKFEDENDDEDEEEEIENETPYVVSCKNDFCSSRNSGRGATQDISQARSAWNCENADTS